MKKILTLFCFSICFFLTRAQIMSKDTLKGKINSNNSKFHSKAPFLKIPQDSNVHYHLKYKKLDENSAIKIPNSIEHSEFSIRNSIPQLKNKGLTDSVKFLQDSLIHRMDSPLKNRMDAKEK
ncbi:hypothetical protein [Sphingobacterium sp. UBA6320]|uniref:hypothetical protein n=1 Tax=Sphingobacterium sp. UBA6320 TaxID=1947510 RepID=UPI0025EB5FE4|nr:hypothetical protein [Sphingobacterium sp. UBA6320]